MKLQVYVIPSIGRLTLHPRFLKPQTQVEYGALFFSFVLRKWRYQVSDFFGQYWHQFGARVHGTRLQPLYWFGNRITTRKCLDEYLFKMIPKRTQEVEFIFPTSVSEQQAKETLVRYLSNKSFGSRLVGWSLMLPTSFFIAKFFVLGANALFSYNVFRINAAWRASNGQSRLQDLVDRRKVIWTQSSDLESLIGQTSDQVSQDLKSQGIEYQWQSGSDVHDEVVLRMQKELKLPELIQSHRRTRMHSLVFGSS
ncbi:hypothetical protein EDD86DRAFT_212107 [Gorgonomyces haynaldii]|nr:hypothetical protein EDD86DRAFT_212107 [Gorgonomyces haynaldii]